MKTKTGFILIVLITLFFITCRKEKDAPTGGNKIEMGNNVIDSLSYFFTEIKTGVITLGGNEIFQHGHCWNTETNPTIEENLTLLGKLSPENDFMSVIDSLEPNTVYFIRPYIQTAYAIAYGDEEQIKTLKTGKPVVSTNIVSDISLTSALCGGIVTNDSGLVVTARGVCWDTTAVFRIDSCLGFTVDSLGLGNFSSEITGLHEGTNYYVAAYATNEKGTGYGEVITFSTIPVTLPVVVTSDVTNITTTSVQCGGNVTSDGNGTVTVRGVCWDTLSTPTFENNIGHSEDGIGLGEFTSNITNLDDGTTYYVVAFATNEKGTGYGEIKNFTATPIITPQVTTADVTSITVSSAQCGGNVTNNGNGTVTTRGVCWNEAGNPSLTNNLGYTVDGSGLGTFTSNITGLEDGVTYYVVAYATNENETGYGEVKSFTTLLLAIPSVTTTAVSNITTNSAVSGGNVTNNGNGTVNARGVCWNTTGDPTLQNCIDSTSNGSGTGSFTSNITGLTENTTYYVRAFAKNEEGTGYGTQIIFTTLTIPTVTTTAISNISYITATSGGNVIDDGGATVTSRGVCWSISPNPTLSDPHTNNGSGTGSFTSNITGLTPNTNYYVRAWAVNSVGTGYGNQISFTTLQITLPTVTTSSITNITSTSATSGGYVTNTGGATVTARGVCWSTSQNPTIFDNHTTDGSGTGSFVSSITGLEPETDYYVRAYATNSVGTAYGNQISFTTLAGGAGEWIQWDAGVNNGNGIGLTAGGSFNVASRWTPADLAAYNGLTLSQVSFFPNGDPAATYVIKVWIGAAGTTLVSTQNVTSYIVDEWNEIYLTTPVMINAASDLWFGYSLTHAAGTYPAGCDDGPAIQGKGDMITLSGTWESMSVTYGLDYNWNLAGYVEFTKDKNTIVIPMIKKDVTKKSLKSDKLNFDKRNDTNVKNIFRSFK